MVHTGAAGSPVTVASFSPQPVPLACSPEGVLTVCFAVLVLGQVSGRTPQ
jgi:hypothetical protein